MKKDFNSAAWSSPPGLKFIPELSPGTDTAAFVQLDPGLASLINLKQITTPFRTQPLDHTGARTLKRSIDISVSLIIIVAVLSWLIPVIALLIKLTSRGPVFFLQKRNLNICKS